MSIPFRVQRYVFLLNIYLFGYKKVFLYPSFTNWLGVCPFIFLKTWLNDDLELKPASKASPNRLKFLSVSLLAKAINSSTR